MDSLPRTFVGFSGSDLHYYRTMCMWKHNENIDFNFCDCQLEHAIDSDNESYIKDRCRKRIEMAGTYVMLIGADTRYKDIATWEAEVAIEQECRLIAVQLDNWRFVNTLTLPPVLNNVGAVFVPFSARVLDYVLRTWTRKTYTNWTVRDEKYVELGYELSGVKAELPNRNRLAEAVRNHGMLGRGLPGVSLADIPKLTPSTNQLADALRNHGVLGGGFSSIAEGIRNQLLIDAINKRQRG